MRKKGKNFIQFMCTSFKKIAVSTITIGLLCSSTLVTSFASETDANTPIIEDKAVVDVEATKIYTKVADLSQENYELIAEYIGEIKDQVDPHITYSANLVPQITETIYPEIPGHSVKVFQHGNDIALGFDNINTYLIEHTAKETPSDPVVTPTTSSWVWMSHVTVTNKDWVVPIRILNTAIGKYVTTSPSFIRSAVANIIYTSLKAVTSYASRQETFYGSQDRYKDKYCSQSWKYVTAWYSKAICGADGDVYSYRITNDSGVNFVTTSYVGSNYC